jgi:hypothetical protein
LGAFAKQFQQENNSFFTFMCIGTTQIPFGGFSGNFVSEICTEACQENSSLVKFRQKQQVLYVKGYVNVLLLWLLTLL